MSNRVTLLDYGMCNMLNVARAFEHCGAVVDVTEDPAVAQVASRLVVPGVGAFQHSLHELLVRGLGDSIKRFVQSGRPFLGICVGMQMLFEGSEEFGEHVGLGILSGRVIAIPKLTTEGLMQRVPHIGWNDLTQPETGRDWKGSPLVDFQGEEPAVYFVHSFAAVPADPTVRLADTYYGGHRICAAVQSHNIVATQFHPERSGKVGLNFIRRFMEL